MSARDSCALRVIPLNESWVAERTLDRGAQQVPWQHQQVTLCFGVHARASLAEAFGLLTLLLAPGASRDIARHLHQTPDKADASPWVITSSERVIKRATWQQRDESWGHACIACSCCALSVFALFEAQSSI